MGLTAIALVTLALMQAPATPERRPAADSLAASAAPAESLPLALSPRDTVRLVGAGLEGPVEPGGVTVDPFGRLHVTDVAAHRLLRYDALGTRLGESGALGSDPGQFRRPLGVVTLGALGVAVLDRENRRVVSYDLFGRLIGVLIDLADATLVDRLGRIDAIAIAADRGGAVVLADAERERLLTFDFSGRFVREIGGYGARAGSFRGIAGVATAPGGALVTTERANARVQRLDAGGRVVATWPLPVRPGTGAIAVAVDDSARIAVADETQGRLWVFDGAGRVLARAEGLAGPRALAFAPDGVLLVAESRAGRVRRLRLVPATAGSAAPGD